MLKRVYGAEFAVRQEDQGRGPHGHAILNGHALRAQFSYDSSVD